MDIIGGSSSAGRAARSQRVGRRFESALLHQGTERVNPIGLILSSFYAPKAKGILSLESSPQRLFQIHCQVPKSANLGSQDETKAIDLFFYS